MAPVFKISIEPQFSLIVVAMLFLVPLPWLLGWWCAITVHEFFHFAAVRFSGKKVYGIHLGARGILMDTDFLTYGQTVFCALAGPVGGLLLRFAAPLFPQAALCGLLQSVYNLLPVFPLDGGRALHGITHILLAERIADRLCKIASVFAYSLLIGVVVAVSFHWKLRILPIFLVTAIILKLRQRKIPCKCSRHGVQ